MKNLEYPNYVTVANVAGTNSVDTGLTNGTMCYYVVSALNAGGGAESSNSAQVSVRPTSLVSPKLQMSLGTGQLQFTWPADHIGWRLVAQTNHLGSGISSNPSDWVTVAGANSTNVVSIPISTAQAAEFYRLVYP